MSVSKLIMRLEYAIYGARGRSRVEKYCSDCTAWMTNGLFCTVHSHEMSEIIRELLHTKRVTLRMSSAEVQQFFKSPCIRWVFPVVLDVDKFTGRVLQNRRNQELFGSRMLCDLLIVNHIHPRRNAISPEHFELVLPRIEYRWVIILNPC